MIYQFIADEQSEYPVTRLCATLGVSVSGFYAWRHRPESQHRRKNGELKQAIEHAYAASWQSYGSPRILAELQAQGYRCSRKRVARLMREQGFSARHKRVRARTTRQDPTHQKAANVLGQDFKATAPTQKWVTDVTAIWTYEGWLYLAGVLDLFSRSVVGWALAAVQDEALVQCALQMALRRRQPKPGLLHHSDRGLQYTSAGYQWALAQAGMMVSMSRTGNCYDNAPMESFWSTLKWECISGIIFPTRALAKHAIFEYIEYFYNRQRRHSSLGYLSPSQYEALMT
ncbi:transposase [Ktedonospora formicarum]|uniref:Transposase n=1 Tax=Ktedonospora formicarum TaxID=2778364 RepID=A0A8J3ID14_9CHLR|nr:transposase [Ktedonospora formicarum]